MQETKMKNLSPELIHKIHSFGYKAGEEHMKPSKKTINLFNNMQNQQTLIIGMIKELKEDNRAGHQEIKKRLDTVNGNVARIKTKQLYLRGILIGAGIILFVLGLLPERLMQIVKMAF